MPPPSRSRSVVALVARGVARTRSSAPRAFLRAPAPVARVHAAAPPVPAPPRDRSSGSLARPARGFAADAGALGGDRDDASSERAAAEAADADEPVRVAAEGRDESESADASSRVLQARLLARATALVPTLGFTDACLRAAAADLGLSPAVLGVLPPPGPVAALAHHFAEECDSRLSVKIIAEGDEALAPLAPTARLAKVIAWRLEMLEPVVEHYPAALAALAEPRALPATIARVAALADEMCRAAGPGVGLAAASFETFRRETEERPEKDDGDASLSRNASERNDAREDEEDAAENTAPIGSRRDAESAGDPTSASASAASESATTSSSTRASAASGYRQFVPSASLPGAWALDRAVVASLYGACELYMLTDQSPGFEATRRFVDLRCRDATALGKSLEEVGGFASAAAPSLLRGVGVGSLAPLLETFGSTLGGKRATEAAERAVTDAARAALAFAASATKPKGGTGTGGG